MEPRHANVAIEITVPRTLPARFAAAGKPPEREIAGGIDIIRNANRTCAPNRSGPLEHDPEKRAPVFGNG
jgi:hypothetical protein